MRKRLRVKWWLKAVIGLSFALVSVACGGFSAPSASGSTPQLAASPTPKATNLVTPSAATLPMHVAQDFYHAYEDCMKNPPPAAAGQVSAYCQSHNLYGGQQLVSNLEAGGVAKAGADPIICAQNPPQSTKVSGTTAVVNGKTTATVVETYATQQVQIMVDMQQENNEWKVENVMCPKP